MGAIEIDPMLETAIINIVQSELQKSSVINQIKNIIKKGITIMKNFKFNLQNHSEAATNTIDSASVAASAAETTAANAVTTILDSVVADTANEAVTTPVSAIPAIDTVITDATAKVVTGASSLVAQKQAEIVNTKSEWVKVRDSLELLGMGSLAHNLFDKWTNR